MTKKTTLKKQKRGLGRASQPEASSKPVSDKEEFQVEWSAIEEMEKSVDEQQVNELTDHVFSSVLSKFGWTRNEQGHLEKTGIEKAA